MLGRNPPAAVALQPAGDVAAERTLGDAGEENWSERVPGGEIYGAVTIKGGEPKIDRTGALLQGDDLVAGDLTLTLTEGSGREVRGAVDRKSEPRCQAGDIGDLELAPGSAENSGQARIRVDNAGNIGEAAALVGAVVDRVVAAARVLDADAVVQIFASHEIIDAPDPSGIASAIT